MAPKRTTQTSMQTPPASSVTATDALQPVSLSGAEVFNIEDIVGRLQETRTLNEQMIERNIPVADIDDDDESFGKTVILRAVIASHGERLFLMTRIPIDVFFELLSEMKAETETKARGPPAKFGLADSLILLLSTYASGLDHTKLALDYRCSETVISSALSRARKPLTIVLKRRWLETPKFPTSKSNIPIDGTPFKINRPGGGSSFRDAKIFYSGKYCIYCVKKEVACLPRYPHYIVRTSSAFNGAMHDMQYFRTHSIEFWNNHTPVIPASVPETVSDNIDTTETITTPSPTATNNNRHALLADAGYIGHHGGLFDVIVPFKDANGLDQMQYNDGHARRRCVIERMFGQTKRAFQLLLRPYPFDKDTLDDDINNCFCLMNEKMKWDVEHGVPFDAENTADRDFHLKSLEQWKKEEQVFRAKRAEISRTYKRRAKVRRQSSVVTEHHQQIFETVSAQERRV